MGSIEEAIRDTFFPTLLGGGGGVDAEFQKILVHSVNCGGLGISDPCSSAEISYNTFKADSG